MVPYCGKGGEAEPTDMGCGFVNEENDWKIEEDAFTGAASRPLDSYHELKSGEVYSLVANYNIVEGTLPD